MKYVQQFLKDFTIRTPRLYINCREKGTTFKVLSCMAEGNVCGLGMTDVMQRISQRYERVILFLDEIDLLSAREQSKDLLYTLSRAQRVKFQLFLLSNNVNFYGRLDEATKSTLQLQKVFFRNYDAQEVAAILQLRLIEADPPAQVPDSFVQELAARTVREANADVRVALKCLELAYLDEDYTRLAETFTRAQEDIFEDLILYQENQTLLVLLAVVHAKQKLMKEIYGIYCRLADRNGERVLGYNTFLNTMNYLNSIGIFLLITRKVTRGWSNKVHLLCREQLIKAVCDAKNIQHQI